MPKIDSLVNEWRALGPIAWAEGPYGWIGEDGRPVRLADWQRAVLAAWWAHRGAVSTLAISNVKKTGKTALNAFLLAWRWLALPGEHFAVGNDLDQSAGRQFAEIAKMVQRHPYLRGHCTVGKKQLIFKPTGSAITALPVDAAGNAGANHLTASHTEAWAIIYEAGIRAYEELTPPPLGAYGDEFQPLRVVDSYAGYEGESETWHQLVDAGLAGNVVGGDWPIYLVGGLLLFHMDGAEARERCFLGTLTQAQRYYADQRRQLRPMAWQRQHENTRTTGAEQFIAEADWRAIEDAALAPMPPNADIKLYAGLDLGTKSDYAAVVGVTPNGIDRARIALHRIWKPTPGQPVSLAAVREYLKALNAHYWLAGVYYDPSQAALLAEELRGAGLHMIEVPQSLPELGPRGLKLWEAIRDRKLTSYPSDELRAAATAAVAKEVPQGLHITKGASKARKIDPIAALSFALPAALQGRLQIFFSDEVEARWDADHATGPRPPDTVTVVTASTRAQAQADYLTRYLANIRDD